AALLLGTDAEAFEVRLQALRTNLHFLTRVARAPDRSDYRFHPIYHRFLASRASALQPELLTTLRLRAADMMLRKKDVEAAARLSPTAHAGPQLISLSEATARRLLPGLPGPSLSNWTKNIPPVLVDQHPWLLIARGRDLTGQDHAQARAAFQQALDLFQRRH